MNLEKENHVFIHQKRIFNALKLVVLNKKSILKFCLDYKKLKKKWYQMEKNVMHLILS